MQDHPQYGRLRVGQIVDVLGRKSDAGTILAAAVDCLEGQDADIAICNHSHESWVSAMDAAGFLTGPSNFIFAAPPALAGMLSPFEASRTQLFFTKADGDGLYQFV
jgi:hypothetical protein